MRHGVPWILRSGMRPQFTTPGRRACQPTCACQRGGYTFLGQKAPSTTQVPWLRTVPTKKWVST